MNGKKEKENRQTNRTKGKKGEGRQRRIGRKDKRMKRKKQEIYLKKKKKIHLVDCCFIEQCLRKVTGKNKYS